jgi:hypothetical protein
VSRCGARRGARHAARVRSYGLTNQARVPPGRPSWHRASCICSYVVISAQAWKVLTFTLRSAPHPPPLSGSSDGRSPRMPTDHPSRGRVPAGSVPAHSLARAPAAQNQTNPKRAQRQGFGPLASQRSAPDRNLASGSVSTLRGNQTNPRKLAQAMAWLAGMCRLASACAVRQASDRLAEDVREFPALLGWPAPSATALQKAEHGQHEQRQHRDHDGLKVEAKAAGHAHLVDPQARPAELLTAAAPSPGPRRTDGLAHALAALQNARSKPRRRAGGRSGAWSKKKWFKKKSRGQAPWHHPSRL